MTKLFVSFVLEYPNKEARIENMVLDRCEPSSADDVYLMQMQIQSKLPEDIRPIRQPTIIWFKEIASYI